MSAPASLYVAVNAAASLLALLLANGFDWDFGLGGAEPATIEWTRAVIAGFGAAALFRSSLFTRRVGSDDVDIGPSSALKILLEVTDEQVDRNRGEHIVQRASELTRDLDPAVYPAVEAACLHSM
jgi:hypothetical protein